MKTKSFKIGNKIIGGDAPILIQSMCEFKTSDTKKVIDEINECEKLGADLMRVSILDEDDIKAIKIIQQNINIPLICDTHLDLNYAIESIKSGADGVRINPGNTKNLKKLDELIDTAIKYDATIRIGINFGSFEGKNKVSQSIKEIDKWVKYFENRSFKKIVLSIKTTDVKETIKIYEKLSKISNYPLHIGVTESGFDDIGIIKSCAALSPLLLKGIGNTIRISLSQDPKKEILTAKRLLHSLGLYNDYPTIISCPTCGRCKVKNIKEIASKTLDFLEKNNINIKVSIMGCVINGIEEGKNADIGIAGGDKEFILFKKGKIIKKVSNEDAIDTLFKEIINLKKCD